MAIHVLFLLWSISSVTSKILTSIFSKKKNIKIFAEEMLDNKQLIAEECLVDKFLLPSTSLSTRSLSTRVDLARERDVGSRSEIMRIRYNIVRIRDGDFKFRSICLDCPNLYLIPHFICYQAAILQN